MRQNIYHKCLISILHTILKHPTITLVSDGRWHKIPSTCLRRRPESCGAGESCELQCDIPKIAEILEPGGGYSKRGVVAQCFLIFVGGPKMFFPLKWDKQVHHEMVAVAKVWAPFTSQSDQPDPARRKLSWMSQPTRPALQHGPRRSEWPSEWPSERPVVAAKLEILMRYFLEIGLDYGMVLTSIR